MQLNFIPYIKELLYQHDRLIIPGLGTFFLSYQPAEINDSNNTISTPSRKISFTIDTRNDDGLFIRYISKTLNVEEVEVKKQLNTFIFDIRKIIKEKGYYILKGVGKLFIEKGKFAFEPYLKANFLLETYGMTDVSLQPKVREEKAVKSVKRAKELKKAGRVYDRQRTIRKVLLYVPITAALVFLFVYIDITAFGDETLDFNQGTEYTSYKPEVPEDHKIIKSIDPVEDKKDALYYTEPPKKNFYIIAGSFKEMVNARQFNDELVSKGYTPEIIKTSAGLYRVALSSFDAKRDAQAELNRLKLSFDRSLWIYTK